MPAPRTALVVEDMPLVASEAQEMLRGLGFDEVAMVKGVEAALALIAQQHLTFALVPVMMEDGPGDAVAEALGAAKVPFVLVSDIGDGRDRPEWLRAVPFVVKPYRTEDLAAALRDLAD